MKMNFLQSKRVVRAILLVLLVGMAGMGKGYAYDFSAVCSTGQTLYYNITDDTNHYVELVAPGETGYSGWSGFTRPTGTIVLPESVQNSGVTYTVTTIGDYAFYYCRGLTGSLTIPSSVTTIGNYAFAFCSGFTGSLTIGNSVTTIGNYAFYNCSGFMGSLTFGNSVTSIGGQAFSGCSGLTGSLTIPNSVTSIDYQAFYGCSGFTGSLTIGNSVTTIGSSAFYGCSGFTGSLTIGNSVTSIGSYAFYDCSGFTGSLTIGNSVTSIAYYAFYNCSGFTEVFYNATNYPDTNIYDSPFKDCSGTLVIGNNVERIPSYMFYSCGFTGSLTIPNSVTTIGSSAFYGCSGFTGSLTIPNSMTSIGNYAFYNCSGFTGSLTIGNSVTSIGEQAFSGCSGLTGSLTIPNSVTSIGNSAFSGCSGFTGSLTISNSVTTIGNSVFYGCSGFTGSLTIPNSVTSIGGGAFSGCSGLTGSLTIPNSVTSIGNDAFRNCSGFTGDLTIGNSVTTIGDNTFLNCSGLTGSLTIPNSVTSIGYSAFSGCSGLAFYGCSGFTGSLTIPNSVTTIGSSAFYGCSGFTGSLTISNSVTSIGYSVFSGCSGFTGSLTIPSSVTTISNYAFSGCSHISVIISFAETPPSCGNKAFDSWITSSIVYVPCGFSEAYSSISWGGFNNFRGLCQGTVTVVADSENGGSVSGGGTFEGGEQCTVTAIANDGYTFEHWELEGVWVSTDIEYTLVVGGDMALVAHFVLDDNIVFADANVKSICIAHWDTNGDGELSYEEAASVTSLGNYFRNNTQIFSFKELQYFVGLSSIGSYEFSGCINLGSLAIPTSLTSIGYSAFHGCSGLTGVYYTGSIGQWCSISFGDYYSNNNPLSYAHNLYIDNELVTDLVIPEGLTEIKHAFSGATCLTSLTIPNSVTSIGSYAFSGCSGLTGSLTIPNSVTTIGNSAFRNCNGLTGSLTIPNSVTSIGESAFSGCNGFTGSLTLPNSVTWIGSSAFSGCSGLTGSLTIPNSVTSIGYSAFYNCSGFTGSLTIPNSVTSIGYSAFYNCSGFTGSLIIPNSVTTIYSLTIGNSVTTIDYNAFYNCSGFTGSLTIPNSVTSIGESAFSGCSGFTGSLTIPNSVTSIGYSAFSGCSGFTGSLTIPSSVTTIDYNAFYNCSGFTGSLTIPSSVTTIAGYAFSGCSGFTGSLTIPNSVTSIGYQAFYGCSGFTGSLTIGNSVTSIQDEAFYGCSGFTGSLTIGNSVTEIGYSAFSGCSGFTGDLTIGNSLTDMSGLCGCSGFTGNLTIGNAIEVVDLSCFVGWYGGGCNFTGKLTLGNSVTTISDYSYYEWGFTEIHSKNPNPPVFEGEVFYGVSRSIPVYVPCEATENYSSADGWSQFTNYQEILASITVKANPESLGYVYVSQYGTCDNPESVVGAWPNYSEFTYQYYEFINWTVDGVVVSTDPYYSFELTEDIDLVANFGPGYNHVFVGGNSSLWSDAENWLPQELPTEVSTVEILANVYVNGEATVMNVILPEGITMTIMPEGVLTVTGSFNSSSSWYWWGDEPSVVIEDGGQLYHTNEGVTAKMKKTITSYTPGAKNGWHLIAPPMVNYGDYGVSIYDVENLSNNEYDLYYYDEPTVYWINQEDMENGFTWLATGKGYLYANNQNINLGFCGELQNGSAEVNVPLSYTTDHALQGFNLVGNPFAHNVTSYASENVANGCYRMNDAKDNLIVSEISEANPLKPAEGFFVKATGENASLTFNQGRVATASQSGSIRVELLDNGKLIDRLIVKKDGKVLEKLSLNEQRAKIFAIKDQQEVSIVSCEGNEQPINFKATKNGTYTLNVNVDNLKFDYLHLIDNLTGNDVNLLETPEYSFDAKTTDSALRFKLVFVHKK